MISLDITDKVAIIQLDRPSQKNALSTKLLLELQNTIISLNNNQDISVVILKGDIDFSAGGDIKEMLVETESEAKDLITKVQLAFDTLYQSTKIIIVYTQGIVFGGGMELAMIADFVISHSNARFSMPEASIGITPGGGGTQYLPRIVGKKNAAFILLSGSVFSADEMMRMGLVQKITDDFAEVYKIAQNISHKHQDSLKAMQELLKTKAVDLQKEADVFVHLLMKNGRKAINNFLSQK